MTVDDLTSAKLLPLMDFAPKKMLACENMIKTHYASTFESVQQCIDSLGDAWVSHPLHWKTSTQLFARCLFRALERVWLQAELYSSQDLVFVPKSEDALLELVADFVTQELVSEKTPGMRSQSTSGNPEHM